MARIVLTDLVKLPVRTIRKVDLRPPGRNVLNAMVAARLPGGFTDAQLDRFGAGLSGFGDATLRRLASVTEAAALSLQDARRRALGQWSSIIA